MSAGDGVPPRPGLGTNTRADRPALDHRDSAPATPPPSREQGHEAIIVGVIVVVAVATLAGVGLVGTLSRSGPPPSESLSFSTAEVSADRMAAAQKGGNWSLVAAEGLNVQESASLTGADVLGYFCWNMSPRFPPEGLTLPSSGTSPSSGTAAAWLFFYRDSANAVLVATVLDGNASIYAPGTEDCAGGYWNADPTGAHIIDSTAAVASADGAGGATFLADHPDANGTVVLSGGYFSEGWLPRAEWWVRYSTCPVDGSLNATGFSFNATVNPWTGTVTATGGGKGACPEPGIVPILGLTGERTKGVGGSGFEPMSFALNLSPPSNATAGTNHWYNFTVESATLGMSAYWLAFEIELPGGAPFAVAPGSNVTVSQEIGQPPIVFDLPSHSWISADGGYLGPSTTISVLVTSSGGISGDSLVVTAPGWFSGSASFTIS